jgi:hypothetical protein
MVCDEEDEDVEVSYRFNHEGHRADEAGSICLGPHLS